MNLSKALCTGIIKPVAPVPENAKAEWFAVGGFSRFASRKDLDMALGNLNPIRVDAILDIHLYASGNWAVLLPSDSKHETRKIIHANNPRTTCVQLSQVDFNSLRLASKSGLSNRSVRFRNVPAEIGIEELRYFLQDYNLSDGPNDICPFNNERGSKIFNHYIVNFATAEEAERVVLEKCFTVLAGTPVQMFWYSC